MFRMRVARTAKYPNLSGLDVYKIDIDSVVSLFINKSIFGELRNQIVSLDLNILFHNGRQIKISLAGHLIRFLFAHVLKMFTNLRYLKFHLDPLYVVLHIHGY